MKSVILLATYNGEKYIRELLDSLLGQTCSDFEIVVHDDGSKDATISILGEYIEQNPGRITLLEGPSTGGAKYNFLWMLEKVEAGAYFFCDQDDVWKEDKVSRSLEQLKISGSAPACVFTDMYVTDEKLLVLSDSFIKYIGRSGYNTAFTQILIDNPAAGCTMCINREMRDLVVRARECVDLDNIEMHDGFILELAAIFGKISFIDEPFVYYRQTGHNEMGARTEDLNDKKSRNINDIKEGSFLEKKRAFINFAKSNARELLKLENLPDEERRILTEFVELDKKNKLARMHFYKKNNFTRAHHNLWMRLFV